MTTETELLKDDSALFNYTFAKEIADMFLIKGYDFETTAEHLIKYGYPHSFSLKVLGYVKKG